MMEEATVIRKQYEEMNICFCSLAFGPNHRMWAKLLAQDLEKYFPHVKYIILTDKPQDFNELKNVQSFMYRRVDPFIYNDKMFAVQKALSLCKTAIHLDADIRIVKPSSINMNFPGGITALSCCSLEKHLRAHSSQRKIKVINDACRKINIDINKAKFVLEPVYAITKSNGLEDIFFEYRRKIADYFIMRRIHVGEGVCIALAAAKAGLPIYHHSDMGCVFHDFHFFKDRFTEHALARHQAVDEQRISLYKEHRGIEFRKRSLFQKIFQKLRKALLFNYYYVKTALRLFKKKAKERQDP